MTNLKPLQKISRWFAAALALALLALAAAPATAQHHGRRGPAGGLGPGHGGPGHGGPGFGERGVHNPHAEAVGHGSHLAMLHHLLSRLDLSDGQREEIRTLLEAGRAANEDLRDDLGDQRRELHRVMLSEELDEEAVRTAALGLAELEAELAVRGARLVAEVREVLTPEQRDRARELHERARERREEWREGR